MEEATLLFRHLPSELSSEERKDVLHHLGATRVQVMGRSGPMKNAAFAVFPSKEEASKIIKQLHQADFLGSKLRVEFSHSDLPRISSVVDNEGVTTKEDPENGEKKEEAENLVQEREIKFDDTFNVWGLKHPRRPDLCYVYPPPTHTTLTNIMHALAAFPKFYVQVLHLMNKMDLPAPFAALTPAPPLRPELRGYPLRDDVAQAEMDISSETESELESDGEGTQGRRTTSTAQDATANHYSKKRLRVPRKRPRLSQLQESFQSSRQTSTDTTSHPPESSDARVSDVFERALAEHPAASSKKIELKLPQSTQKERRTNTLSQLDSTLHTDAFVSPASQHQHSARSMTGPRNQYSAHSEPHSIFEQQHTDNIRNSSLSSIPASTNPPTPSDPHPPPLPPLPETPPLPPLPNPVQTSEEHLTPPLHDLNSMLTTARQASSSTDQDRLITPGRLSAVKGVQGPYDVPLPPPVQDQQAVGTQREHVREISDISVDRESNQAPQPVQGPAPGFGILQPQVKPAQPEAEAGDEEGEKEWDRVNFISSSELRKGRLSRSELKELSAFRRYNEGQPSCRLYIKNLAKQVTDEEIHWIFGRYVNWEDDSEKNIFDVRVMKEGRMKGQAFVTLPTERAAKAAVRETNGFVLKDKPMAVQFARSAQAKEDEASVK